MHRDGLYLVPLGGTGEIGMNLNVYVHHGRLLVVDCGVLFERKPDGESSVLYPDISFLPLGETRSRRWC